MLKRVKLINTKINRVEITIMVTSCYRLDLDLDLDKKS